VQIKRDEVNWQELDGEVVVLDLANSEYLRLNGSAAQLWRKLVDGADVDDLADLLIELYGIDEATAAADVGAFLGSLEERGLLRPSSTSG
jgi:hypothetical protein